MPRETILARLQAAQQCPDAAPRSMSVRRTPTPGANRTGNDLDRLMSSWQRLGGTAEMHDSPAAARLGLLLYLRTAGVDRLLVVRADDLPLTDLAGALDDAGIRLIDVAGIDRTADYRMGLVGVDAALADTGSLAIPAATAAAWLPALMPESLVVVVLASQVVPDLEAWRHICETGAATDKLRGTLVLTGPSTNADLEIQVRRGFFGPSQLHLIVLRD